MIDELKAKRKSFYDGVIRFQGLDGPMVIYILTLCVFSHGQLIYILGPKYLAAVYTIDWCETKWFDGVLRPTEWFLGPNGLPSNSLWRFPTHLY